MTFNKGFLKSKHKLKPSNLFGGLLLWILFAYIFYAFFQLYREAFRLFTSHVGDKVLLVLTPTENYLYNLFYAAIASVLGYSVVLRFFLQNSVNRLNRRTLLLTRRTLNSEGFWTWSFLLWFGKLGSLFSTLYLSFAMQYVIDFITEFAILLILLPLVLFYSSWPTFSRLIRDNKTKWFVSLSTVFILMSFTFAFKNFTDYKRINEKILNRSIPHVFDLQKPNSQSQQEINWDAVIIDIYIVKDTLKTEEPAIFFGSIDNRVNLQNIRRAVAIERDKVSVIEEGKLIANMHIDERIAMKQIKPILDELRKANLYKVQYSTGRKYSRYPSDFPAFKNSGIERYLYPEYYPEFDIFLDSAEQIDLRGKTIKLSESLMYRNGSLNNDKQIEITVTPDSVTLNNHNIDSLDLEKKVYGFIKKYSPNYVIIFNSSDEITYKRYIEFLDILYTQVDRLRNELSLELYGQPFDYWDWEPEKYMIETRYPRVILEWTTEEQRLNELLKKVGKRR